jgi:hypothetical protein
MEKFELQRNSQRTGVSTFAIRTSHRTDQKLQKSLHLTDPRKEFQNIFSNASKKIKHPTHKPDKKALDK